VQYFEIITDYALHPNVFALEISALKLKMPKKDAFYDIVINVYNLLVWSHSFI